jgi:crotonobetainyl-CoA:carnitine CoA-transferase CaiB-like acyl-CoA transferase
VHVVDVGVGDLRFVQALDHLLGAEGRKGFDDELAQRDALRQVIVDTFALLTAPQVVERLEAAQIANARVNTMHDVWAHPQLAARKRWREVGSPVGPLPALLPPGTWDEEPRMDPVPALGEHTDAVLAELGLDAGAVQALRAAQAI